MWVLKDVSDWQENSQKHPSTISSSGPTDSRYLTESHVLQTLMYFLATEIRRLCGHT